MIVALLIIVAGVASFTSIASAGTYTGTPLDEVANGLGSSTQRGIVSNIVDPGIAPAAIPSGAPFTWGGQADGAIWKSAKLQGMRPASPAWGTIAYGAIGAVAGYAAFNTGLWIGGAIAKRWIYSGYNPGIPLSSLATSLPSGWAEKFGIKDTVVTGECNFGAITNGDRCLQTVDGGVYYFGGRQDWFYDVGGCATYSTGNEGEHVGTNCSFSNDTGKSLAVQNYNSAMRLLNDPVVGQYWHVHLFNAGSGAGLNTLYLYSTASEFEKFLAPRYDPAHSSAQSGDATPSFTAPSITTTIVNNFAGDLVTDANAGDPAAKGGVERTNCYLDSTYCPGGINDPNAMDLLKPLANETYGDYAARLVSSGYLGSITDTEETTELPGYGPDAVTRVIATTHVYDPLHWPSTQPVINAYSGLTVRHNPSTATPAPTEGQEPTCGTSGTPCVSVDNTPDPGQAACDTCAIDWTPIEGLDIGSKFPFGVPAWVSGFFGGITFVDNCPTLSIGKPSALGGGSIDIPWCSTEWEDTYRPIVFPILEALMTLAAITFLGVKIFGMGGNAE